MFVLRVILFILVSRKPLILVAVLIALTSVLQVVVQNKVLDYPNRYVIRFLMNKTKAWLHFYSRAFFISTVLVASFSLPVFATCRIDQGQLSKLQQVEIKKVIDGDSLLLSTNRQLRLVGVNTPEIKQQQPLAKEAKQRLSQILNGRAVFLRTVEQSKDRYGRLLGHLFLANGQSVEALLLQEGFGFLVAIPPNIEMTDCLVAARDIAKDLKLGVWAQSEYQVKSSKYVAAEHAGFTRISGKLQDFKQAKEFWWLQLQGSVVLRIKKQHQTYFDKAEIVAMLGQEVVVSGWMVDRDQDGKRTNKTYARFMLLLTHPAHIELMKSSI